MKQVIMKVHNLTDGFEKGGGISDILTYASLSYIAGNTHLAK